MNRVLISTLMALVYILPMFYTFYNFLPQGFKWITEGVIYLVFALGLLSVRSVLFVDRKMFNFLLLLTLSSFLVYLLSTILNGSNLALLFTRSRYLLYPILFYVIFSSWIIKGFRGLLERWISIIAWIQVVLVPIQSLLYRYFPIYHRTFFEPYSLADSASGTFGRGNGSLGIFLIMVFIYYRVVKKKRYAYVFLTLLLFLFSGGANVFLILVLGSLLVLRGRKLKMYRLNIQVVVNSVLIGLVFLFVSGFIFQGDLGGWLNKKFASTYYYYLDPENRGDAVTRGNKVHRVSGVYYIMSQFENSFAYVIGNGPDAFSKSSALSIESSTLGVSRIKGGFLLKLLESGFLGVLIFYGIGFGMSFSLWFRRNLNDNYLCAFLVTVLFFSSSFYTKSFNHTGLIATFALFLCFAGVERRYSIRS